MMPAANPSVTTSDALAIADLPRPDEAPSLPPGPRAPRVVQLLRSGLHPTALLAECSRRYGDAFTLRFPGRPPIVLFSDPESIRDIFNADPEQVCGGEANDLLAAFLGRHSLVRLDGARHLRERRLMLPAFHGERMADFGRIMRELTAARIAEWPIGRPFPVNGETQWITLEVLLRAMFGLEEGAALGRLRERVTRLLSFVAGPAAVFLLLPFFRRDFGRLSPAARWARYWGDVDTLLREQITRRRTEGSGGRPDLLSMLLDARDEEGRSMSDEELRDQLLTLLLAGHETTATSLAWAIHHVLTHPEVLDRIRAEIREVAGDGDLEPAQANRLPYLEAVVNETLRLTPVIPEVGRLLREPTRIGRRFLSAGVVVSPSMWLTHHRADLWPEPDRFMPERFLGTHPAPHTFLPWGGGSRRCIGAAFATYEMKVVLAEIFRRVDMRPDPRSTVRLVSRNVTFAPSGGVPVVVDRVAAGSL